MAHRHEGIDDGTLGIFRPMPVQRTSAAILPDCALRARWRCRQCRRVLSGDRLIVRVRDDGQQIALTALAATASPILTMAALRCPRCDSDRIAMVGEN
jgi:hypothetical protein